jgi:hypothetical protein
LTPEETAALLRRLLSDVEENKGAHRLDIVFAALLAMATLGTAWCTYQSIAWEGDQRHAIAETSQLLRDAMTRQLDATQHRMIDAVLLEDYFDAELHGDAKFAEFLRKRVSPQAQRVLDDWLSSDPIHRADSVPLHPLRSSDYVQPGETEAKRLLEAAEKANATAERANVLSDRYSRLTVVYAAVLFFAGIGATFKRRPIRWTILVLASILLTFGAVNTALQAIAPA